MVKSVIIVLSFTTITIYNLWFLVPTVQAQDNVLAFILLTTKHNQESDISQVQSFIKTNGGHVTHTFPHQALIARIPADTLQQLAALPSVAGVFTRPVELSTMDVYGPYARRLANVWNNLVIPQSAPQNLETAALGHPDDHNDAFTAPDLPSGNQLDVTGISSVTPGYYQTSDFMAGSVAVGVMLVESNGTVDASTENWSEDEKLLVFSEIVAALNWWAQLDPRANLSFVYDDHFSNPLPTGVEPITRPYYDQRYWIADAMDALGYTASSYFTRVRDYNNNLRATYQTDWAFTIFVVDSSGDPDNRFSNGYFAYAYLGGPFMVMTYGNNGYGPYNMDAVAAHEVGHIFYALDQYYSAYQSCTRRSGYLNVENQNSQYGGCGSNVTSIMRGQVYPYILNAIDPYAAGQIGWRDSDGDNIFDPLDTDLPVSIETIAQEGNNVTVSGTANIVPYPSPSYTSVTINTLTSVQYRFDSEDWQVATATDGAFDATTEAYHFSANSLSPGLHVLEVAAVDSAGNESDVYATATITIFDPVDKGLNTEFATPQHTIASSGQIATLNGVAYHMHNGIVAQVEYRLNDGPWQSIDAQDGAFDSNYEPFILAIDTEAFEPGTFLSVDARATDADGNVEVNFASHEIEVSNGQQHALFIPMIMNGS